MYGFSLEEYFEIIPPFMLKKPDDAKKQKMEICFFESERALIYFEPKTILESYNLVANYEVYWRAIARGIEHQLSIRTCLQRMETTTTELTEQIPKLLLGLDVSRDDTPPDKSEAQTEHEGKLDDLASDVSEIVSLLPKLRQISTTATAFRSGKAINKFDRLGRQCFQFPDMLRNIQQNVNELGDFLQYAKAQEMRKALLKLEKRINKEATEEKKRDNKFVRIGLLIAVSSIIFASFSFLTDADSFFSKFHAALVNPINGQKGFFNSTGTKAIFIYMILCLMLWIIIRQTPAYLDSQTNKKFLAAHTGVIVLTLVLFIFLVSIIIWG